MAATILADKQPPSDQDIVCMRGKAYWNHPGNIAYRQLIDEYKDQYAHAGNCKFEKSLIVSEIIEIVKERNSRFVKKSNKGAATATKPTWVECNDDLVREKISQSLRDGLSTIYKSATRSKKIRRQKENNQLNAEIERVIFSNTVIANKISELNHQISEMKAGRHPCNIRHKRKRASSTTTRNDKIINDGDDSDNDQKHDACDRTLTHLFDEANYVILETIKTDPNILSYSWEQ